MASRPKTGRPPETPGRPPETPGRPTEGLGDLLGASRDPGARAQNLKKHGFAGPFFSQWEHAIFEKYAFRNIFSSSDKLSKISKPIKNRLKRAASQISLFFMGFDILNNLPSCLKHVETHFFKNIMFPVYETGPCKIMGFKCLWARAPGAPEAPRRSPKALRGPPGLR